MTDHKPVNMTVLKPTYLDEELRQVRREKLYNRMCIFIFALQSMKEWDILEERNAILAEAEDIEKGE
jgi:hypothetical protein